MQRLSDFWRVFHNFAPGLTMMESWRRFNALDNLLKTTTNDKTEKHSGKTGIDCPGDCLMHFFKYLSLEVGRSRQNALTLH